MPVENQNAEKKDTHPDFLWEIKTYCELYFESLPKISNYSKLTCFSSVFKTWFDGLKHWVYYGIDQVFVQVEAFTGIFRTKYSRMDQLKFVEGSL